MLIKVTSSKDSVMEFSFVFGGINFIRLILSKIGVSPHFLLKTPTVVCRGHARF